MFISDAGRSHGGFEYTAGYDASMTVRGKTGKLELRLAIGLGDALEKHAYGITGFAMNGQRITCVIDGQPLVLVWVEEDTVWDHEFDNYYIASWGGDAPPEEIRGQISTWTFPGLTDRYYVELRLRRGS